MNIPRLKKRKILKLTGSTGTDTMTIPIMTLLIMTVHITLMGDITYNGSSYNGNAYNRFYLSMTFLITVKNIDVMSHLLM